MRWVTRHATRSKAGERARRPHRLRPFQRHLRTTSWGFVRFHFGARGRRANYSNAELAEWAARLAE